MTSGPTWSLITYRLGDRQQAGVLLDDGTVLAPDELSGYDGLLAALEDWEDLAPRLREWTPDRASAVQGAGLTAPILYPGKLICAGANYGTHLAEMGIELEGEIEIEPFFFLLPATNTVIGHEESVSIPASADAQVDWEGELAVVIGRRGRNISREDARTHVAGYTIINDVSERAAHRRKSPLAPPFEWDWLASKGRDTFNPMGPGMAPEWLVGDPHDLHIKLWINDDLKQDSPTSDLLVDVWDLIAHASRIMTLAPGDVIATGSPPGVGKPRGEFLSVGDRVTIEISRVGRLVNHVEEDRP